MNKYEAQKGRSVIKTVLEEEEEEEEDWKKRKKKRDKIG